eukprot:NODE_8823_length_643_cov_25.023077_g8198_i0.p1 GENE.NODE_8823_length_643_cov_25.023077_g8198_i0~~NODE_8823_length_643_cov_25.023077_g8198_i0.p1  ORF type:complete len:125 (-),score=18.49 NODE_8823_length_643_cov_25.023077_g8198_i0:42-416(-)
MASVDSRGPRDNYGVEESDPNSSEGIKRNISYRSPLSDDTVSICTPTKNESVVSPTFLTNTPNPGKIELLERYLEDGRKARSDFLYEMEDDSITSGNYQHDICDEEIEDDMSSSSSQSSFSSLW